MPPIQQQQTSRAGLITALVISIIFALGFLVWAIMNNNQITKLESEKTALTSKYKEYVDDATLTGGADVDYLKGIQGTSRSPLFEAAIRQMKSAVKLVTGSEGYTRQAEEAVEEAKKQIAANDALKGTTVPIDTGLTATIKTLADKIKSDADAVAKSKADLADVNKRLTETMEAQKAEVAKRDQAVQAAEAKTTAAETASKSAIEEKQKQVDEFSKKVDEIQKQAAESLAGIQQQVDTLTREKAEVQKKLDSTLIKLATYRVDVKNPTVRNIDATITQIAPDSICYIDLGYGDHIVPGLTFEVYDKLDGMPKFQTSSDVDLPKGKGSIEILNVGQNSSQCRIIYTAPGQQLSQGDLCANLIYDKNVKPVFYLYGQFDMDNNGVPTEGEAEQIKALINRWGGQVSDKLTVNVDYVIMGKEPAVPVYSKEEQQDPLIAQRVKEAQDRLKAFDDVRNNASTLHIPVLNQTRFLYYIGYFQAYKK